MRDIGVEILAPPAANGKEIETGENDVTIEGDQHLKTDREVVISYTTRLGVAAAGTAGSVHSWLGVRGLMAMIARRSSQYNDT